MNPFLGAARVSFLLIACVALALVSVSLGCGDDKQAGGILIDTSGGDGGDPLASGAGAGQLTLAVATDNDMGNVLEILSEGNAGASFTPASGLMADLGANPLIVPDDLVIEVDPVAPPGGTPYAVSADPNLYISDGVGELQDEPPVTGIQVDAGATLELPLNFNFGCEYVLSDGVENRGTITVSDVVGENRRGSLRLTLGGDYIGTGTIETFATLDGQFGGDFEIVAEGASIYNAGDIETYGAGSATGGSSLGGGISLMATGGSPAGVVENTGDLVTRGGHTAGGAAEGGYGGMVALFGGSAVRNAGLIDARGGDGDGDGGFGAEVWLVTDGGGPVSNAGRVWASGGDGADGTGGPGGNVTFTAYGDELRTSGSITSEGGDGAGANGFGGRGGQVLLETRDLPGFGVLSAGDVWVSGTIRTGGGHGEFQGGDGGNVRVASEIGFGTIGIHLVGYDRIVGRGGGSPGSGSNGATVSLYVAEDDMAQPKMGTVEIEPPLDLRGGDAEPGVPGSSGGEGGVVLTDQSVITVGSTDLRGGTGEIPGGDGEVRVNQ